MKSFDIEKLITVDETGFPKPPTIRQLQDKDLQELFKRDRSKDKSRYMKEVGVIYYLGDPKSPARQQGLSDAEALQLAIDNYDLPKGYKYDKLVEKLIKRYYKENITEAGSALENLQRSIHLVSLAANKINDYLNDKLKSDLAEGDIPTILNMIESVNKQIIKVPDLVKSMKQAYENLRNEEEEQYVRGGLKLLSSQNADDEL